MSWRPFRKVIFRLKSLRQMRILLQKQLDLTNLNKSIENGKFPNCLKLENITPVFKKGVRISKNNYRPVIVLPVFERLLSRQLFDFFHNIPSKFQCGFRKGYGTQHCLLLMLKIWNRDTGNNKAFGLFINWSFEDFWLLKSWFVDCQIRCAQSWHRINKCGARLFN